MFDRIKDLVDLGLPIIPVCTHDHKFMSQGHIGRCKCPGKTPLLKGWQTHSETTMKHLQSWAKQFKSFNVGLPLGDASGYCGIDVDGEEGVKLLEQMSKGDIPPTWEFVTGAGVRLIYAIPEGMKTKKFKQTGSGDHQECALLCNGQQTVLPPSIHYTGTQYEWAEDRSPWDIDCAMAPQWLLDLIKLEEPKWQPTVKIPAADINQLQYDLDAEFTAAEFKFDVPENVVLSNKNVREQVGKTGHKIQVTEAMLTQPIQQGNRDNAMTAIVGHYCANRDLRRLGKDMIYQICMQHNMQYCNPPLEEVDIRNKVDYFFDAETAKDAAYAANGGGQKKILNFAEVAERVIVAFTEAVGELYYDQVAERFYYTTSHGPWVPMMNEMKLRQIVADALSDPVHGEVTWAKDSYINEVLSALKRRNSSIDKHFSDFDIGHHARSLDQYIIANNGMVDWRNGDLLPWDSTYRTTIKLDVEFDPDATCPRFEKYLRDWLPDPEIRMFIQEYLGYCLLPQVTYRKALFLYGTGRNGKSMLVEFIQNFFGTNASHLSYDNLTQRFQTSKLKDKLVNIHDDTTVSFTKDTGMLKNLINGGTIIAEDKGKNPYELTCTAKFIYSAQEKPKTADHSDAWYGRWAFIEFPNQFRVSHKAKMEIETALHEERSGIFNWMIKGLKRLRENDAFTEGAQLRAYTQSYKEENDNVMMFLAAVAEVELETEKTYKVRCATLYDLYVAWSEDNNLRILGKQEFNKRMHQHGFFKCKGYYEGKSGVQIYNGVQVTTETLENCDVGDLTRMSMKRILTGSF